MIYKFTGENFESDIAAPPMEISSKQIQAEHFNLFEYAHPDLDGFDGFNEVWNSFSEVIGRCMITFSELEVQLDTQLYELINNQTEHLGMVITRSMTYDQKCKVYIELLRMVASTSEVRDSITLLKKHLIRAGEIRNAIAHAKWPSLTSEGYVFSRIDSILSDSSVPELKYYKIDKLFLENAFDYISAVGNFPYNIAVKYQIY